MAHSATDQHRRLVVALDGSDSGFRALQVGADLAQAMGRALEVLYVFPHRQAFSAALAGIDEETTNQGFERLKSSTAQEIFDEADRIIGDSGRIAERHLLVGEPAEQIIEFMQQNSGTHLVIGRRGLSRIKSLIMGSVSNKVAAHAPGLVTVVS